jgi:hypothetical protein
MFKVETTQQLGCWKKKLWINGWATPEFEWFPNFQICETSYHSLVQHNRALNIWRCKWDRLRHAFIIRVVSHCGLATCIKKYLKAKGRNSKISPCTNIIFKQSSKRNQNPSRYYNSIITNLKSQYKPKISTFKNPHVNIDQLLRGQNPLSYYTL